MALTHNSKLADREPRWGDVDKKKLPRKAFADVGDPDKVSTWKFPHHWVKGGGTPDDDGRYTTGEMYLHEGGLNAGWAAAMGARAGRKAKPAVISHLRSHRTALGKDDDGLTLEEFGEEEFKAMPEVELQGKPFPNEHAARLRSPNLYKRFRRQNDRFGAGVDAIWGVRKDNDKVELQALRFDKTKFTVAAAKKWLKDHDYTAIRFEPATAKDDEATDQAEADRKDVEEKRAEIEKQVTYRRFLDDTRITVGKTDGDPVFDGYVEGYASAFDVIDHQGDVVRKGAFTKTIAERGTSKIPLMAMHFARGGDISESVGVVMEMREDSYGLKFRGEFLNDEKSQEVREKIKALRQKDVRVGTSIGYRRVKGNTIDEDGRTLYEHTEIALAEITLTLKPANEGAFITDGKSDEALVAAIRALAGSKQEALEGEKSRFLEELGGREKAEELAAQLDGVVGKIRTLLAASQPQDADEKAGSTDGEAAASTSEPVDLHSARARVGEMRRRIVLLRT